MNFNCHFDLRNAGSPVVFDPDAFEFDAGLTDVGGMIPLANDWASVCTLSSESEAESEGLLPDLVLDIDAHSQSPLVPTLKDEDSSDNQDEENESKRSMHSQEISLMAPKVMKNDIRRAFPKMLFNAINCGEFQKVQDFSTAFILPTCPFVACVQTSEDVIPPPILYGVGPRIHVHYTIGSFVMFPDMVATMGDVQIITSNKWSGTKIVIPWDCRMTKTHHIPTECWIPPPDKVEQMYAEPSIERMMSVVNVENRITTNHILVLEKKRKRGVTRARKFASNQVPLSYHQSLMAGAVPVPDMPKLQTQGQYTIMLDENNQVQSILLVVSKAKNASHFQYVLPLN